MLAGEVVFEVADLLTDDVAFEAARDWFFLISVWIGCYGAFSVVFEVLTFFVLFEIASFMAFTLSVVFKLF